MTPNELSKSIEKWLCYHQSTSMKYIPMTPFWTGLSHTRKCKKEERSDLLYRVKDFLIRKPYETKILEEH